MAQSLKSQRFPHRRLLIALLGAVGMGYAFLIWLVFFGGQFTPTENEAVALARLRQPTPPVVGRDGTNAMWVLGYDVPMSERERVGAALRRYYNRLDAPPMPGETLPATKLINPLAVYNEFPKVSSKTPGLCPDVDSTCLATIRSHLPAALATLAAHQGGLQSALDLTHYDGFRYGVTPSHTQTLPSPGKQRALVRTHFAAMYLQGRPEEAMSGLCGDIGGWRRLGGNTDSLIGNLVGLAFVRQDLTLLAEMMAQRPPTEPLPAICADALAAPTPTEQDMCPAMRTEFQSFDATISRSFRPRRSGGLGEIAIERLANRDHLLAKVAPVYGAACDPQLRRAAATDRSWATLVPAWPSCSLRDGIADPVGCGLLAATGKYNWSGYFDRRADLAAQLSLLRTVAWLRLQDADPARWPALLAARPSQLEMVRKPIIAADGKSIAVTMFYEGRGKQFRVVLPEAAVVADGRSP